MSAGKVFLYVIGAAGLLGITYGFFYGIGLLEGYLGSFQITVYSDTVWIMSGVLAVLIVFSAIAKNKARLEMLSSATFLIYYIIAYSIGCSILSVFIPYNGFGSIDIAFIANLTGLVPGVGAVSANIVVVNAVAAWFIVGGQILKFINTFFKSMKRFKDE